LAMHVEDHPVEYGHFEGIIPKGEYGGGTVMLWDLGTWECLDENPSQAYRKGHLHIVLKAKKLKGQWNLFRLKNKEDKSWFLVKANDKYARPLTDYDILLKKPNSVLSGYDLDEIAEKEENVWSSKKGLKKTPKKKLKINLPASMMPEEISPQLATLVSVTPEGSDWLHEIKFDGYRILTFLKGKNIHLMSRRGIEWTKKFPNIANAIKKHFKQNIILDGEVVLLDKQNKSNFQLLQNALDENKVSQFIYYIFDILYYDQYDLMLQPLIERKKILQKILPPQDPILRFSDHIIASGMEVFKKACEMNLEGIISKEIHSIYQQKRTKSWLKSKCIQRQEFVIGGMTMPGGARNHFGSLYLGYYDKKGILKYCGNVGTGFNQASLKTIYDKLQKIIIKENPFDVRPPGITSARWVKPIYVAEVEFIEWTKDGMLRHPSFKGLRMDKSPKKIHREKKIQIKSATKPKNLFNKLSFKLTHPGKVLYPEDDITKIMIANYYEKIAEWILPYIVNRPLTLVRAPENYKKTFYQKHLMP
ncbi:MAG TPA: DNA ligase D, partial [Gammaproteobacteria bacterium]|nr:DNA ligase D [Gammaproteobacteria bacterium]